LSRTRAQIEAGEALLALSLKRCGKCGQVLHLESFHRGIGLGGTRAACKPCYMAQTNKWRSENISRVRELERVGALSPERLAARRAKGLRYAERNREAQAAKTQSWREANPEKVAAQKARPEYKAKAREYSAKWREANPDKVRQQSLSRDADKSRASCRAWKSKNPEKCREYARRAISTPQGKIRNRIRVRIRQVLGCKWPRGGKTFDALGYTPRELKTHLERQFLKGMSWGNMDEWHVDHIIPLASFSYTSISDPQFRRAWALSNLRPMWAPDNLSKSAKIVSLL
jgi:hypothetical protein